MRTLEEIQKDYATLCGRAGDLQYRIHTLQSELTSINTHLRELNEEASKLPEKEKTDV